MRRNLNTGFASIELLVVIAVVVVLAALFFLPALGRAKQRAQETQCLNNLRHLSLGWQMFNADNKGVLPNNDDEGNQPGTPSSGLDPQWCPGRMDPGATPGAPTNTAWLKAGQIYSYVGNPSFYRCPADSSTYTHDVVNPLGGSGNPRVRSVSMNAWLSPPLENDIGMNITTYRVYRKESDLAVPGPGNLWLLSDENPYTINDGSLWEEPAGNANPPVGVDWKDYPATYHNGAAGITFCDGHAQMRKWTDPVLLNFKNPSGSSLAATPPRTDLLWLLQRTTAHK